MLFYESIESHPSDWSALIFKDQTITFGDLRKTIDTWAAYLQAKGVQKGDRVGLFSKNCPEFVTAYHAIVKAGAIVVPINFMLSPTETSFILKDAGIKLLMTQEALDLEAALEKREYSGVAQLTFAEMAEAPEAVPATVKMHEDECCTIIYTSGTTGNPKGAMLSHKNILANIHSFTNAISMEPKDKAFCVLPMHHCFGWTVCVAGPMLKGGAIVIQDNYNVAEILRLIVTHKVDQFCGIPTFAQMFLRAAGPAIRSTWICALPSSSNLRTFSFTLSISVLRFTAASVGPCVDWIPISNWNRPSRAPFSTSNIASSSRSAHTSKWKFVMPLSFSIRNLNSSKLRFLSQLNVLSRNLTCFTFCPRKNFRSSLTLSTGSPLTLRSI
ncbi:MAG: long-chain fatty acid--CoA ligase, partial [Phascolarctobacterium sp.]|nr:long-chain fatty acid--CoA ligase [Phascolarctobacterium sp.]